MGTYQHDMRGEKDPTIQLPVGWHEYVIVKCEEKVSSQNNDMFVVTLALEKDSSLTGDVYAVATQGKRWFLKQLLAACDAPASEDGVYDWDISDILDKHVMAQGVPTEDKWIDREGNDRVTKKTKIVGFRKLGDNANVEEVPF